MAYSHLDGNTRVQFFQILCKCGHLVVNAGKFFKSIQNTDTNE